MITSPQNEKLKLARKLRDRRWREREGMFVAEGEDLVEAALAAGAEPVALLCAAGSGLPGEEVEPALLEEASSLGSGTRTIGIWRERWAEPAGPVCVYLHGVADPGNVGAIVRSVHGLVEGTVVLGPRCADPFGPKAVRASMGSVFGQPLARGDLESTPEPRFALLAHGGSPPQAPEPPLTVCLGAEREGLPPEALRLCGEAWTVPLRPGGAESLNVAAAAAIVCERISSRATANATEGEPNA